MAKLLAPSGFRDFLPDAFRKRQELIGRIRQTYEAFGFEGMETPAMENVSVFLGKGGGENEKLMFHVLKRGADLGRAIAAGAQELSDMALRFDLTVPLARYYATHRGELPGVFKRYQIGPVWRAERAQHGRFREFVQCDVDVIGSASMAVEADVILATTTALARLGFTDLTVRLNSRPLLMALVQSFGLEPEQLGAAITALDKLDKETPDTVRAELVQKGISEKAVGALLDFQSQGRGTAVLDEVERRTAEAGAPHVAQVREVMALTPALPSGTLAFDPFLARGLDYYTGPIFEIAAVGVPFTLAAGGRFDDLIERLSGAKAPACGFSIGFERVFLVMEERGMFDASVRAADVFVAAVETSELRATIDVGATLRAAGLRVDVHPKAGKLAAQLETAEKKRIPFAALVSAEHAARGAIELRELATRQSTVVPQGEAPAWLRGRLG